MTLRMSALWPLALAVLVACSGGNPARDAVDASSAPASTPAAVGDMYSCPMHPEVVSDHPGKCPKCGMDLVKQAK